MKTIKNGLYFFFLVIASLLAQLVIYSLNQNNIQSNHQELRKQVTSDSSNNFKSLLATDRMTDNILRAIQYQFNVDSVFIMNKSGIIIDYFNFLGIKFLT